MLGDKINILKDDHKAAVKRIHADHESEKQNLRLQCQQTVEAVREELGKQNGTLSDYQGRDVAFRQLQNKL